MNSIGSSPRSDISTIPDLDALPRAEPSATTGYLVSLAMTAIATVMAVGIDSQVTIPNLSLLFVVPVIVAAVSFGLGASVFSAVLGALAYNFFLTEPRYSLTVDDPANIWAIALLFIVGLIVSTIAFTSRRRATEAALLQSQMVVLQNYGRDLVAAGTIKAIVAITVRSLAELFRVPAVLIIVADGKIVAREQVGRAEPGEAELDAARRCLTEGTVVRAGVYPDTTSRFDFWPVATATGPSAVIGLAFDPNDRPSTPGKLVDIAGNLLTLVLERQHARAQSARASSEIM